MFDWLTSVDLTDVFLIVTSVIGTASVIATVTPNKTDDKIVKFLSDVINFLAANFGKAKNDPKA